MQNLTNTPELYYLLASPRFCSFSYKYEMGRAMVELMPYYKSGRRYKRHLGTVLLQWYKHGNMLSIRRISRVMLARMRKGPPVWSA